MSITHEEIVAELQRLGVQNTTDGGHTVEEWCELWGQRDAIVRRTMKRAQAQGLLKVGKGMRKRLDGVSFMATTYSFVLPPAKKPRKKAARKTR